MRVFISYSHEDAYTAQCITNALRACGVHAWLDELAVGVGQSIPTEIAAGLTHADYVILLISHYSVSSRWVMREWSAALHMETSIGCPTVLPVRLDDSTVPTLLADRQYADFRKDSIIGLTQLMARLRPALLQEHCASQHVPLGSATSGATAQVCFVLSEIARRVTPDGRIAGVVPLLNTLLSGWLPKRSSSPDWLVGSWQSLIGWGAELIDNREHLLRWTADTHNVEVSSACMENVDFEAFASFGSACEGLIDAAEEIEDGFLLFTWMQLGLGGMYSRGEDFGRGFLTADSDRTHLNGLWWYGYSEESSLNTDARSFAYLWSLKRVSKTAWSDTSVSGLTSKPPLCPCLSHMPDQHYPISGLVLDVLRHSGLPRDAFVKSLGYTDVEHGLSRLETWIECGDGWGEFLSRLAIEYSVDDLVIRAALSETRKLKAETRKS